MFSRFCSIRGKIAALTLSSVTLLAACGTPLSPREQCYVKDSCSTAVEDCVLGGVLLNRFLLQCSPTSDANNFLCSDNFTALICVGSDKACYNECDESHPF
jgi:hypothetical protein